MRRKNRNFAAATLAVCVVALALAGCGRRGDHETPIDAAAAKAPRDKGLLDEGATPAPKRFKPVPPNQPFLLDPLL